MPADVPSERSLPSSVGVTLGRYRLFERIGRGPIGAVWKAKSFGVEGFEKTLVVKRVLAEHCRNARFVDLLVQQAKLVLRLSHANVVQVFDLGREDLPDGPAWYLAMELVAGLDLGAATRRTRRAGRAIGPALAVHVASEIAKGLDHAHRRRDEQLRPLGIVHRGLRPPNVLLSWEGEVKVSDFALATARGPLVPASDEPRAEALHDVYAYMSPEQAAGEAVDARTDLFSLGTILYELLAGEHPFRAASAVDTLARAQSAEHVPLAERRADLPPALLSLVARLLAKDPDERPPDAAQVHEELLGLAYASGTRAGPGELAELLAPLRRPEVAVDVGGAARALEQEEPVPSGPILPSVPPSFRRTSVPPPGAHDMAPPSLREAPPASTASPSTLASRFVGRHRELRRIGELMAVASRRRPQVLTLAGPSGIGKSRLLREAGRRLRRSAPNVGFHLARCSPDDRDRPLAAAAEMLRSLAGGTVEGLEVRLRALGLHDGEVEAVAAAAFGSGRAPSPARLRAAFARMLASLAEERLQVLAWDDAHAMDRESAELIEATLSRLASARLVVLLATRDAGSPLRPAPGRHRVEVSLLDPAEVEQLAAYACGAHIAPPELAAFCRERGEGSPGLVESIVAELIEAGAIEAGASGVLEARLDDGARAMPRDLVGLLAMRTARLPEEQQAVLRAAAVIGERFEIAPLASMLRARSGRLAPELDALAAQGWIVQLDARTGSFPSAAVRDAVLAGLAPPARRRLHAMAATAWETILMVDDAADHHAARVARHWLEAGDPDRAAGSLAASARHHLKLRQHGRAAVDLGRALSIVRLDVRAPGEVAAWIALLAEASEHAPPPAEVLAKLEQAALCTERGGDDVRLAAHLDAASIFGWAHRFDRADRQLAAAHRLARGRVGEEARVLAVEAELLRRRGDFRRAREGYEKLVRIGFGETADRRRIQLGLAQAHAASGDRDAALAALERAAALGPRDEVAEHERVKLRAVLLYLTGDFAGSARASEEATSLSRALGDVRETAVDLHNLGDALLRLGELPRAYATLQHSAELCDDVDEERIGAQNRMYLAYLDALNGAAEAEATLHELVGAAAAQGWRWDEVNGRWLVAQLALHAGDRRGAKKLLVRCGDLARASGYRLVAEDCDRAVARMAAVS